MQCNAMQSHADQNNAMHCCAIFCTAMHYIAGYSKEHTEHPSLPPTLIASKTRTKEVSGGLANTPLPIVHSFYPLRRSFVLKELKSHIKIARVKEITKEIQFLEEELSGGK